MIIFFLLLWTLSIRFSKGQNPLNNLPDFSAQCSVIIRDVGFLLDASQSISTSDFQLAKTFMTQMITFTKISNAQNRIAFVVFGDSADIVFNFSRYDSIDGMIKDVEATKNQNGLTAIGKALNLTLVELFPTMRTDADKLIILFTDGTNNKYPAPYIYADKLKDAGVTILTIGIGSDINSKELGTLASPGLSVKFDSFSRLISSQNQIISHICPIPDPGILTPCQITKMDLVVVLDSSESISGEDYVDAKRFLTKIFEKLDLGPVKSRVAMISFSNTPRVDFNFDEFYDISKLVEKLRNIIRFGGLTGIGKALQEVQSKFKPQQRSGVPFNILLITDGVNNIFPRPFGIANSLKADGANIITLGIGSDINLNELKALSSNDKILTVDSFDELDKSLKTILETVICDSPR